MVFSEPAFLFCFLPLVLLAHFGLPRRFRDLVLLVFSLGFYAWGERVYVVALLASIGLNYVGGIATERSGSGVSGRRVVALVVAVNLLMLAGLKYANFFANNLSSLALALGLPPLHLEPVHLPIGISFFAFQGMSYVIDVYRRECPAERSLLKLAMYKSFFPQLIAGPIVRYVDVREQVQNRQVRLDEFGYGIRRFVVGLAKKMLIANAVARPVDEIFALPADQLTTGVAWVAMVGYALQIYFDFSAYSDMAIGLAHLFGFRFLENFRYPYAARSITEFWRRWHISLSTWFRDYLYIPLGGNRVSKQRAYLNLMIVFFLCGLWHGASWNFVIWGMFHGLFLIFERLPGLRRFHVPWAPLQHTYVVLVVLVGWVFFRAETLPHALAVLTAMLGFGAEGVGTPDLRQFVDTEVVLAALLGVVGSTPIVPWLGERVERLRQRGASLRLSAATLEFGLLLTLFLYSTLLMAAGSYSPFIYFRF